MSLLEECYADLIGDEALLDFPSEMKDIKEQYETGLIGFDDQNDRIEELGNRFMGFYAII